MSRSTALVELELQLFLLSKSGVGGVGVAHALEDFGFSNSRVGC